MTRSDRYEIADALRKEGATWQEIADIMDVNFCVVANLFEDPDGSKRRARKAGYRKPCVDCGEPCGGSKPETKRCKPCSHAAMKFWTKAAITDAILEWVRRYGSAPSAYHWNPTMARRMNREDAADRFYDDGCWPATFTVQREFGSWNAAIAAAGLAPLKPGHKHSDRPATRRYVAVAA